MTPKAGERHSRSALLAGPHLSLASAPKPSCVSTLTEVLTSTPSETPARRARAPLALALLQGALVGAGLSGVQAVLCGQDYVPLELWGGLAVGLALTPVADRFGPRASQAVGALLGLTLAALFLLGWSAPTASALGLAAGLLLAREARGGRGRASLALAGSAAGALAAGHLAPLWAAGTSPLLPCLGLALAAAIRLRPASALPARPATLEGRALWPALRLATLWVLSAGALRFVASGWPEAAALAAAPLLAGLALALLLGPRLSPSRALALGAELLGWGGVWLMARGVPDAVRGQGAPTSLWLLLLASGLLAAPAWARARAATPAVPEGRPSLLRQIALACARVWGRRSLWPSTTCLLEAKRDARQLRLLSQAGQVRSALPDRRGSETHPEAPAVVAAALAAWNADALGGEPLVQAGLGDGVLAATLGRREAPPQIYESDPSLLSLHAHPARPFAFRVGELGAFRSRLHLAPPSARPPAGLVAYALAPTALPSGEFVAPLSVLPGAWLRALNERQLWAFAVGEGLVLTSRLPSLAELEAGWERDPGLAKALAEVGLRRPLELLSCLAASPSGLAALAADHPTGSKDLHASEVVRVGARTLAASGPDLGSGPQAAAAGAALADLLVRRASPAALPFARAAVASLRSSTTLRTLGDVLHIEAARANRAPSEDPVPLWAEALELDPRDVGARLALGWHHYDRKDFNAAQRLLLPAVHQEVGAWPDDLRFCP